MIYQESQLLDLVAVLYDCALDPLGWKRFLSRLSAELNSPGSIFFILNPQTQKSIACASSGLDPTGVEEYNDHYVKVDLRVKAAMTWPEGLLAVERSFVPEEIYRKSEILNDFLLKYDFYHMVGGVVLKDPSAVAAFGVQRHPGQEPFGEPEVEFLNALSPHLKRAGQLTLRLARNEAHRKGLEAALDYLPIGVALVNEEATVLALNRQAEAIIAKNDGLATMGGRLCASRPRATAELRRLIAAASSTTCGKGLSSGGALSLPRPSLLRPLSLLVTPAPASEHRDGHMHPTAVVFITDPEEETHSAQEILMHLYRLTRAEARLASVMMQGTSLREAADRLQLSYETCRSQLKSVFLKTETSRQTDLVRMLLRSPAGFYSA